MLDQEDDNMVLGRNEVFTRVRRSICFTKISTNIVNIL